MANQEHVDVLKQGVEAWNKWREQYGIRPDLSEADLSGSNLSGAWLYQTNFYKANLSDTFIQATNLFECDFRHALLCRADFNHSLLDKADLSYANLNEASIYLAHCENSIFHKADLHNAQIFDTKFRRADFNQADLSQANLREANLIDANLSETNLTDANLIGAILSGTNLSGANLSGANLYRAILVNTNLTCANLSNCFIHGIAAWNVHLEDAIQKNLIITLEHEPTITVDNLEVAQFIYLLLNNPKIRDVIDTIAKKAVLILGRFTPERKAVLDALREALRIHGYLPILFDFEKPSSRDFTETVSILAHLSRFVIVDLTSPNSVPYELGTLVHQCIVPFQPILLQEQHEFAMLQDLRRRHDWLLPTHSYRELEDLLASLQTRVIEPAEQKAQELEKR